MWSVEQPLALTVLLLLPPAIYWAHYRRDRGGVLSVSCHLWGGAVLAPSNGPRGLAARLARWLFWLAFATLIVAAAGPVRLHRERVF